MADDITLGPNTRRFAIIAAVVGRLNAIRVENTFQTEDGGTDHYRTDAGTRVTLYEAPELGQGDPVNAIAVFIEDSDPTLLGGYIEEPVELEIQALAKADPDEDNTNGLPPSLAAEELLGDIRRAMEQPSRTLPGVKGELELGTTRVLPREPGRTTVGVAQRYKMIFVRKWGHP